MPALGAVAAGKDAAAVGDGGRRGDRVPGARERVRPEDGRGEGGVVPEIAGAAGGREEVLRRTDGDRVVRGERG